MPFSDRNRIAVLSLALLAAWTGINRADEANQSNRLVVSPAEVRLSGPDAALQLLVDVRADDSRLVDVTSHCEFRSSSLGVVSVSESGLLRARGDGKAVVEVTRGSDRATVPVVVSDSTAPRHLSFSGDVVPILSKFGCNGSGCHGKAEGQNGFKLSVFGFDPPGDYQAITMQARGRRVFPAAPKRSLLLRKITGEMPHGGGVRIDRARPEYNTLRDWIASGMSLGSDNDPQVVSLVLEPGQRQMKMETRQQLRATALLSDGRKIDVTELAQYQSNNDALATVDERGQVSAGTAPGQVAVMASYMGQVAVFQAVVPRSETIENYPRVAENNFIDHLVYDRLRQLNIVPSGECSDSEFLRRAYLDIIGTLPTADEARRFLTDREPNRRQLLVDELLKRDEFADYWALQWADLLRVDRQVLGHKAAHAYYRWIRQSLADGKPLDQFAREIIAAEGPLAESPQGYIYKVLAKPNEAASGLSQVFLGVRIECAQCHHHPFDRWSQTDYYGMTSFFAQVKRKQSTWGEVLLAEGENTSKHPRTGETVFAHALGTQQPAENPAGDRRRALAEWLASADNPWFARSLVNRVWARMLGRGLVEPVDDFRDTNPPSNPELLDALAADFINSGFDLRHLIRTIAASRVYQHAAAPNETNGGDQQNYSRALWKRLDAEVLLDAVCQTTGVAEKFEGVIGSGRAIELWDSQVDHDFLKLFGRPLRKSNCECERVAEPSVAQVLHLLNSERVDAKLSHATGTVARLVGSIDDDGRLVEELYLTFRSRFPTAAERQTAEEYLKRAQGGRRRAAEDLVWTLLNSLEFMFNR